MRLRGERIAATASLAITLMLGWIVVSAIVWRQTADAELPPRPDPEELPRVVPEAAPKPVPGLHDPVVLPPPPARPVEVVRAAPVPRPAPPPVPAPPAGIEPPAAPEAESPPDTLPNPTREPARALAPPVPEPAPELEPATTLPERIPVAAIPPPAPVSPDAETVREGRTLLKLLERGQGPDIEIAWPSASGARARLYETFEACFGMRSVVVGPDGRLFVADGPRGRSWEPDPDRVSGYARQPRGALPPRERDRAAAIRQRHGLSDGRVIRVFPREVDAMLLGALGAVATDDYRAGNRFRARYEIAPGGVRVADIEVNGRPVGQPILLEGTCARG